MHKPAKNITPSNTGNKLHARQRTENHTSYHKPPADFGASTTPMINREFISRAVTAPHTDSDDHVTTVHQWQAWQPRGEVKTMDTPPAYTRACPLPQ